MSFNLIIKLDKSSSASPDNILYANTVVEFKDIFCDALLLKQSLEFKKFLIQSLIISLMNLDNGYLMKSFDNTFSDIKSKK